MRLKFFTNFFYKILQQLCTKTKKPQLFQSITITFLSITKIVLECKVSVLLRLNLGCDAEEPNVHFFSPVGLLQHHKQTQICEIQLNAVLTHFYYSEVHCFLSLLLLLYIYLLQEKPHNDTANAKKCFWRHHRLSEAEVTSTFLFKI